MAVVRILAVHLTGPGRQQALQSPKAVLNPTAAFPRPYEPRPADGRVETHHVELLLTRLRDNDDGHRAIRRTGSPQPHITHPRDLRAVTPGPLTLMLQVLPLDLAPGCQRKDRRAFPFHEEGALVCRGHVAHKLRIAEPTIRDDHRRGQVHAAPAQGSHASIEHTLH